MSLHRLEKSDKLGVVYRSFCVISDFDDRQSTINDAMPLIEPEG
jgi:hypothetical protein